MGLLAKDRFSPSTERPVDIELLLFLVERGDVVGDGLDAVVAAHAGHRVDAGGGHVATVSLVRVFAELVVGPR